MGKKLVVEKLKCLRCLWEWWPKVVDDKVKLPERCPKCNSPYWCKERSRKRK